MRLSTMTSPKWTRSMPSFWQIGTTMGTRIELERLAQFVQQRGIIPVIDSVMPLTQARDGFEHMVSGDLFGKVIFTVS